MTRILAWLGALALAATSCGCLVILVQYPDGAAISGDAKVRWKLNSTDSFKTMVGTGNLFWACEPCFQGPGIPCSGRGADGLPPNNRVAQPGTAANTNVTAEYKITSAADPTTFPTTNARATFRYDAVATTKDQSACTGDDTSKLLFMHVPVKPSHNTDELIYHRCHSVKRDDGTNLFNDNAFCTGSLGWSYCVGTESQLGDATFPCGGLGSPTTCGGLPHNYLTQAACCSQYVPTVTAKNAYGEGIPVTGGQPVSSPTKSLWRQGEGGTWEVTLGWDFQSDGVPIGGCYGECCPACGGAAAGTLAACYCRICKACGGGEKTGGCQCVQGNPIYAPWISYQSFAPNDQYLNNNTALRLSDAVIKFDAKDAGYVEVPNHATKLAPFDIFYGTAFWINIAWDATWAAGTLMPTCGPGQVGCLPNQSTPGDGSGCNAWCDPGRAGKCYQRPGAACLSNTTCNGGNCVGGFCFDSSTKVCHVNSECPNGGLCAGGQGIGYQLSIGPGNGAATYGEAFNDSTHRPGRAHGPRADGIQYASRASWGAQVGFADSAKAPWNFDNLSPTTWRTYTIDVTRDIAVFQESHVLAPYGCGGPASKPGGTGWTGSCSPHGFPDVTVCASSCLDPAAIGHAGQDRCQNGGCYQHPFAELDPSKQPLLYQFGLEGGWASKHLVTVKNVRAGTHAGIR